MLRSPDMRRVRSKVASRVRLLIQSHLVSIAAGAVLILSFSGVLRAADFSCGGGNVACLVAAINAANANGQENTIVLGAGVYTQTAPDNNTNGPNGFPAVTSTLTIRGAGANATIIERAGSA